MFTLAKTTSSEISKFQLFDHLPIEGFLNSVSKVPVSAGVCVFYLFIYFAAIVIDFKIKQS